jgi:hypothetical protein
MEQQFIDSIRPFVAKFSLNNENSYADGISFIDDLDVLHDLDEEITNETFYYNRNCLAQNLKLELNILLKQDEMKLDYIEGLWRKVFKIIKKNMSIGLSEVDNKIHHRK